jgi:hypothetical protein
MPIKEICESVNDSWGMDIKRIIKVRE